MHPDPPSPEAATYAEAALADILVAVAPWFRSLAIPTLVAGTFLTLAAARFVEQRGLGAGVSVLLGAGAVAVLVDHVRLLGRQVAIGQITPLRLVAGQAGVVFAVVATWLALRQHRAQRPSENGPALAIRAPASGLSPLEVGVGASGLLVFASLRPTWIFPALAGLAVTPIFVLAFNRLDLVSALLARAVGGPLPTEALATAVRHARARAVLSTLVWVVAVAAVPPFLDQVTSGSSAALVASAVALTAIVMDLSAEWRARRREPTLVPIWPVHRVYEIDVAVALLADRGIEAHPRAARHRTLLQFFGPFVPVDLLVPEDRAASSARSSVPCPTARRRREPGHGPDRSHV